MARQYSVTGNYGNARRCEAIIRLCRSATEIDPDYARRVGADGRRAGSVAVLFQRDRGMAASPPPNGRCRLDANLAEAHAAKARVLTSNSAATTRR